MGEAGSQGEDEIWTPDCITTQTNVPRYLSVFLCLPGAALKVVAIHGLPTSPRLWERLALPADWEMRCPLVPGLGDDGTPDDWSLEKCVEQLRPQATDADVLVGHDLGGVLCAMMAQPGQTVVLSGTALGLYWKAIRWTAWPVVHRWFYQRHGGRHFLSKGSLAEHSDGLVEAFGDHGDGWPDRMRQIAQAMKPPTDLGQRLGACDVHLAWGAQDPWYPPVVARSVQKATAAQLHWLPCGHFAPWEVPTPFAAVLTNVLTNDAPNR